MIIGEDRNKDRLKNWQLAVLESSRFVGTELTKGSVYKYPPYVTKNYHLKVLERPHLLQYITA